MITQTWFPSPSMSLFFVIFLSLLLTPPVQAKNFKSTTEAAQKLELYTVSDIEGDVKRLEKKLPLKIDDMFNDLEKTVKLLDKNPLTEDLAFQMERVCLLTFIHDPSAFAVGLILPVYQKNKDLFEKAAKKLPPEDQALILKILKSHDQAETEGDG